MMPIGRALLAFLASLFRSRLSLQVEIVALRHQLTIYERSIRRPRVRLADRLVWAWLTRGWARGREVLVFVQPATVLAWQRSRFREHWARLSRRAPGRPASPTGDWPQKCLGSTPGLPWGCPAGPVPSY